MEHLCFHRLAADVNDALERPERSYRRKQDDRDNLATIGVGIGSEGLKVSPGMLQGERVLALFERSTLGVSTVEDFDRLPISYRAIATDLNTGQAVVLRGGSLAMAMRASMSLPGIFQPVEVDGRVLLDGGLANQVPIDVVRAMGADIVIAVDVGTPLTTLDRDASLLEVLSQMTGMMTTETPHGSWRRWGPTMYSWCPHSATTSPGDFQRRVRHWRSVPSPPRPRVLGWHDSRCRPPVTRRRCRRAGRQRRRPR